MGLTLVSYTVQDISDDEGYLDALGQEKTVAVRSEARKEVAKAKSFMEKEKLNAENSTKEKEIENEQTIALKRLDFEQAQARHLKEHYENLAKSEKAGDSQIAEINRSIVEEELKVSLLERDKERGLILKKKELKQLELADTVEKRAELECTRQKLLAKAYEEKAKSEAKMEAEKIRRLAEVRAEMIRKQKEAEADVLRKRAIAFREYGNAAKMEMVLAILPRLTAEIAGPITDCKKISSVSQDGTVGFSRVTNEILDVVKQVCDSVANISGQSFTPSNSSGYLGHS